MGLNTTRGNRFTSLKLLRLLRNPFYKGLLVAPNFDVVTKGVHEPLVDEELWDRVQAQLAVRGKAPYRTQCHKHLLRGLIRCVCGMAMTAEFHNEGSNNYLRCMTSASPKHSSCGQSLVRLDRVIAQIEEGIIPTLHVNDVDLEVVREELRGLLGKEHHALEAEIHVLKTRLAHVKDRAERLLELRLDGEITKEEFQEKRAALELEQAKATRKLEQSQVLIAQGEDDLECALSLANQLPTLWARADEQGRREVLEAVFVRFVVGQKRVVDTEVRPPYSWLGKWAPGADSVPVSSPQTVVAVAR